MAHSPPVERLNARSQALRQRRIAVLSTPAAGNGEDAPRLRRTIDQSCRDRNVVLTEELRRLAMIFDQTDAPLSVSEVWTRARDMGLRASRSLVYVLIRSLVASRVLIIAENGHAIRYATPLATRLEVREDGGRSVTPIEDPMAIEGLIAALLRTGRKVDGYDIVVDLIARDSPGPDAGKR